MRNLPDNIVLEGFMGVGKTTIGKAVAERLGYLFIDIDDEVKNMAGISIHDMLQNGDLSLVRSWENKVCKNLVGSKNKVIATGGGVFTNEENALLLRKNNFVVCLERDFDTVYRIISNDPNRVMAYKRSYEEIKNLLDGRTEIYRRNADYIISVNNIYETTKAIIDEYIKKHK